MWEFFRVAMNAMLFGLVVSASVAAPPTQGKYLVLVDPGPGDAFLPAARRLAEFHKGEVVRFDSTKLDDAFAALKERRPDFVAFVLPPDKIDVDLSHEILARSTRLDDDPFVDFEYAFVTGRDGKAAEQFVERINAAWDRKYGRKVTLFGSWEGVIPPSKAAPSALKAMKAEGEMHFVRTTEDAAAQAKASKAGLAAAKDKDLLLFFSHGYPDEMARCFRAPDLKDWKTSGSVLVNCACYNGAPGRWFAPAADGVTDMGVVKPDDSVCLAVLDSGVAAYVAGIDPWHGPLAFQMTGYLFDDGMRLGQAAKMMHDRLALAFLPDRVAFEPTLKNRKRFAGEGVSNRRHNGAGMIVYGDPAFAPFAANASRTISAELDPDAKDRARLRVRVGKQVDGPLAEDFMLPMSRLLDYYSVRSEDVLKEAGLEIYRVIDLPAGIETAPALVAKSAKCGKDDVQMKPVQTVIETTPHGLRLHVRVPIDVRAYGSPWPMKIANEGLAIELDGEWKK
jgi:hypothetical protein